MGVWDERARRAARLGVWQFHVQSGEIAWERRTRGSPPTHVVTLSLKSLQYTEQSAMVTPVDI